MEKLNVDYNGAWGQSNEALIARKVNEIVRWINNPCDSLGCNTLPEKCCEKCQVDHSKCCDRTKTPCINEECECHHHSGINGECDHCENCDYKPNHTLPEENDCPHHGQTGTAIEKYWGHPLTSKCSCQPSEPKHNHINGTAGCGECQKKEYCCIWNGEKGLHHTKCPNHLSNKQSERKEENKMMTGSPSLDAFNQKEKALFDMVYQWGKIGIVTDEKCNAFQDLIREIKDNK